MTTPLTTFGWLATGLTHLQQMASVVGDLEPKTPAGKRINPNRYLPTYAEIDKGIRDGFPFIKNVAIYIAEVRDHWIDLKRNHQKALEKSDSITDAMATTATQSVTVPKGLSAGWKNLSYRVKLRKTFAGPQGDIDFRALVEAAPDENDPTLVALCTSSLRTLSLVHALRQFDDTCVRLIAASTAANSADVPLSVALSIYRQEGNLVVFPSVSSFDLGIPSGALAVETDSWTNATISTADAVVEEAVLPQLLKANCQHRTWLADASSEAVIGQNLPGPHADHIKYLALGSYFFARGIGGDFYSTDAFGFRLNMFDWPGRFSVKSGKIWAIALNRVPAQATDRERDDIVAVEITNAGRRIADASQTLAIRSVDDREGEGPTSAVVLPEDPVLLISTLILEAIRLLQYYSLMNTLLYKDLSPEAREPLAELPVGISYMRYNLQHSDVTQMAVIMGALLRVAKYPPDRDAPGAAARLHAALTPELRQFLKEAQNEIDKSVRIDIAQQKKLRAQALAFGRGVRNESNPVTAAQGQAAQGLAADGNRRMKTVLDDWLTVPEHADELWDYIQTVPKGGDQWDGYLEPRQNLTSFKRLHAFYKTAFDDAPAPNPQPY